MVRALVAAGGLVGLLWWCGSASAHGCHHGWQQSGAQGWHSHGLKCDLQKGIGVSRRAKQPNRRPA